MTLKEFQKELKNHVSKDNLSETLEAIIKYSQNENDFSKIENSAIIVKAKLDRISRAKIKDEITSEDYHLGRNQVSEAILSLINDFDFSELISIPNPLSVNSSQKDQIKDIIADNDKIFIKIILAALALSVSLFFFCIYYENYGGGGASLSSFAGAAYIYNNNKKQMLLSLQAAN
jgi:hypothetical protein